MKRALFIGRFQPFHKGHIYCVKKLLKSFDEVIIVVGSAQESRTKKNPFTAGERVEMIRLSFKSELSRILILPVPDINNHLYWVSHILSYVPKFDEVYSNNELVLELFKTYVPNSDFFQNPDVDFSVAISATVVLIVAGLLAGFFPAMRAARINPIVALKDEV